MLPLHGEKAQLDCFYKSRYTVDHWCLVHNSSMKMLKRFLSSNIVKFQRHLYWIIVCLNKPSQKQQKMSPYCCIFPLLFCQRGLKCFSSAALCPLIDVMPGQGFRPK